EEEPGQSRVAIVTNDFWRGRFNGDPEIVGRKVLLNAQPYEIVGVLPSSFWWNSRPDIVVPLALNADDRALRVIHSFQVIARRKPGVSLEQARGEMDAIGRELSRQYPTENNGHLPQVGPLRQTLVGDVREALLLLLGAVGLVLLIACANVATLLLARGTARRKEMAIRVAVGAAPGRLVRQLLTESALLALAGGAAGVLLAAATVGVVGRVLPARL